ncbi:glycosyltransferase [Sinomonas sp. ASV322]|uniref:glycosyltransferase family 2 protein n=1 Tax=Sinomonas sp. ASV322 TaxID=3041920 RepID=UPI0027DE1F40|nr:glycosyltransferase [Sinomonas sp. ASV322]MDQ4504337.1 glycosyltransferase [Sinomonas sp. ASV322]
MLRLGATPLQGRPRVSVVVPCYNYGRFLPEAVGSALDQPGVDVDVIIVDDASTDGSAEVAEALAAADSRVTLVRHERNRGHIATYNDGLSRVSGDLAVLLSADDVLAAGSLARSAALFEARPDVGLVYGYAPSFDSESPPTARRDAGITWSVWSGAEWTRRVCERGTNLIVNPEAVVRRPVLESIGGYDPAQPHAADMHFWLRAAALGGVGRVNGAAQAHYRVHGGNMHLGAFEGQYRDALERRIVFDSLLRDGLLSRRAHGTALTSVARESLRAARRGLAEGSAAGRERAADFEALALDCDPGIRWGPRWALYKALGGARARGPLSRAEAFVDRVRWSVAWRRWRRYGT